jgi:leucyl aminopeptidase
MRVDQHSGKSLPSGVMAIGVPVASHADGPRPALGPDVAAMSPAVPTSLDPAWCKRQGFSGKVGQTITIHGARGPSGPVVGEPAAPDVVLVGLGDLPRLAGDSGLETLRRGSAAFVRSVGDGEEAAFLLPSGSGLDPDSMASAVAEGAVLSAYRYEQFRTGERPGTLAHLYVSGSAGGDHLIESGLRRGERIAESVSLARDLVNEPPSSLTPAKFADVFLSRFADVPQISIEVWDEDRITEERLGGLLGVARGSTIPPRFIRAEYSPADPLELGGKVPHVVLVGKGITFDSGGLSLKTAGGMETMKTDMGGAAAVLSAIDAAAALGSRIRVTVLTPLTENMPSGSAVKPGDVLTARNGKTIEVLNTDAEGRLVLADGLSLAAEEHPDAIIDLATLTGAAIVALGKEVAGILGNDESLISELRAAADRGGESLWPLPMPEEYRSHIDSEIADMRNVGRPGQAGSIAAAMLLREFVGEASWAHLDIAGPARSDENTRYLSKGGTGFGVRTLVALLLSESFARSLVADSGS